VLMRCSKFHEWEASANNLLSKGSGCPECASEYKLTKDEMIDAINLTGWKRLVMFCGEYIGTKTNVIMRCDCGCEWRSIINAILRGVGCPSCSGHYRYSGAEREKQINSIKNIEFIRWVTEYENTRSRAVVKCLIDGHEWNASVDRLVNGRTGCPRCAGKYIYTESEAICAINSLENINFVDWEVDYRDCNSRAVVNCNKGHEWVARVGALINKKTGCPCCAVHGFNPSKYGTLYMLRSECGMFVKVGISNNHKRRIRELIKETPFNFEAIELYNSEDGKDIAHLEKEFHRRYESAGFVGFDGATEWLKYSPELLEEFRCLSR